MWTLHTDSGNSLYGGQYAKNIYLGDTRIVTKLNSGKDPTYQEESQKQYYYHSDHLGSASLISDYNGKEYQRIEYTPYGETWVEKTSNTGNEFLPYKFTGKEIDEETGLYYYGARYLDPKYSLWISADPALGDYIPGVGKATANDVGNLPGMGGAFNHINFNLYHYAGNNPVKYVDPDGNDIKESELYSFSAGVFVAGRISFGVAKDSNHKVSVYVKIETGIGFGGSIAKADTLMNAIDTGTSILENLVNDYSAIETIDNIVSDTGKENFDGSVTYKGESVFDWQKNGQSVPVEAAVIVGACGDKDNNCELTVGATAIANVYLREDTWYFDITKGADFVKEQIYKVINFITGEE